MNKNLIVLTVSIILLTSCNSIKNNFTKDNYNYSVMLFNKNLGISWKFYGDMKIIDSTLVDKKKIKKYIKGISELERKKIIAVLETTSDPDYETILFYDENKAQTDTITRVDLLLNDTKNNRILYKKSKANKIVYLFLKPIKVDKHNYHTDAKNLIDNVTFDNDRLDKTTYSEVFFSVQNENNYLISRNALNTKILNQTDQQKWQQYQFLTTINSFISNNTEYDILIAKSTKRYQPTIDSLQKQTKFESKILVYEEIKEVTKNAKVVMLNEKHWCPNHRMLAFQFLELLKENGFNYLAIEAVQPGQDSVINKRGFPSLASGYYTREPYFAHFIRKAKSLGFTIVSYEDMETKNRELAQAVNIKKIVDQDPDARIFVYAGVAHILESDSSSKKMAEYFKELTQIDPLTFSQDAVIGDTGEELVLLPSTSLKNVSNLNTSVDYFIINNIKPSLENVYDANEMIEKVLKVKKIKNKNLFIRIYNKNEYDLIGKNAIPISITTLQSKDSKVDLNLPSGNYFVSILSDKDEMLFDDFVAVQ